MKHVGLNVLVIVFLGILLFSCKEKNAPPKQLFGQNQLSDSSKACVLVESDSFIVSTNFEKLYEAFKPNISKKEGFDEDKKLFREICEHKNECPVYVNRIAKLCKFENRLVYIVADLLESGGCVVYNKMMQRLETKVIIRRNQVQMGYDGRIFLIGEVAILKTVDIIY